MSLRELLEEHRSIAKKATPGPWDATEDVYSRAGVYQLDELGDLHDGVSYDIPDGMDTAAHIAANSPEVVEALLDVAEAAEKVTNPKNYRGDDYSFLMSKNVMGLQAALSHLEDVMGGAE